MALQVPIPNHEAVGGCPTHCGWNSVLEGVGAGVPMVTWPILADQSFNEKLVVDVLGIGVRVGARISGEGEDVVVKSEKVERAVDWVMGSGEEDEDEREAVGGGSRTSRGGRGFIFQGHGQANEGVDAGTQTGEGVTWFLQLRLMIVWGHVSPAM